ncbi:MAG: helix-hairpin-helix domain-containing protein [candidate division WOR-3 bacterium]
MLTTSERRVLIFFISVLLLGSLGKFLYPVREKECVYNPFPININTATEEELTLLPFVGKVLAKRIVEYREKNGGFKTKEEIMKVKGFGEVKFQKIKDKICVEKEISKYHSDRR